MNAEHGAYKPIITPEHVINDVMGAMGPELIADYMRANKIVGEPGVGRHCPVTNLVQKVTGVEISTGLGSWYYRDKSHPEYNVAQKLPDSVAEFVRRFDDDRYPELVQERSILELRAEASARRGLSRMFPRRRSVHEAQTGVE